ncbi:MAG TPA: hypothetical protein VFP72_08340 [Kineosporiaceae bacterium]|nr:hypothetical protein [Kineosporiaceae bacterium]
MRSIPVKESAFAGFMCVMAPEAKVVDTSTGEVRKDRQTGATVYSVGVVAIRGRDSSVIQVAVVGEPSGVSVGTAVRVVDLEAVPWERDGRSGVAWRAASIVPTTGPAAAPAAGAGRPAAGSGEAR